MIVITQADIQLEFVIKKPVLGPKVFGMFT